MSLVDALDNMTPPSYKISTYLSIQDLISITEEKKSARS